MDSLVTTSTSIVSKAIVTLRRSTAAMFSNSLSPSVSLTSSTASPTSSSHPSAKLDEPKPIETIPYNQGNLDEPKPTDIIPWNKGYGIVMWILYVCAGIAALLIIFMALRHMYRRARHPRQETTRGSLWLSLRHGWRALQQRLGVGRPRRAGPVGGRKHRGWWRLSDERRSSEQEGTELMNVGR